MGVASQMMGREYWVAKFRWEEACNREGRRLPRTQDTIGTIAPDDPVVLKRVELALS